MSVATSAAGVRRAVRESVSGLPREFWWLWTSTLVNRLGAFVATFLVLYLTVERGLSASFAGLVASLYGLGGVVASLGGGVMADRLGRRPTMLVAQCATAASVALLGFMQNPLAIAAVAFCVGTASSTSRPAVQAMMADIVREEDRVRAFSLNYWAINLGFAVSSAAAGFVAQYSYRAGFLGEAAMTLLCAVVVYTKVPESKPETGPAGSHHPDDRRKPPRATRRADAGHTAPGGGPRLRKQPRLGRQRPGRRPDAPAGGAVSLGTVFRDARFMTVVGLSFVVALIFQQGMVGLPVAMGEAGFSSADFGLAIAANGLLIVVVQIPATRFIQRRDPQQLLIVSSLIAGYGFGLTAFAGSLGTYLLTVCVWTLAEIVNAPTQTGLVVRLSPTHGRGRYQGTYAMSWSVASLAAPIMSGTVLDHFGADWLWGTCAVLGTIAGLGYWLLLRGLPSPTDPPRAQGLASAGDSSAASDAASGGGSASGGAGAAGAAGADTAGAGTSGGAVGSDSAAGSMQGLGAEGLAAEGSGR